MARYPSVATHPPSPPSRPVYTETSIAALSRARVPNLSIILLFSYVLARPSGPANHEYGFFKWCSTPFRSDPFFLLHLSLHTRSAIINIHSLHDAISYELIIVRLIPATLYQRQELCAFDSTRPFRTPLAPQLRGRAHVESRLV
jgi:hypothetical protein